MTCSASVIQTVFPHYSPCKDIQILAPAAMHEPSRRKIKHSADSQRKVVPNYIRDLSQRKGARDVGSTLKIVSAAVHK